MQYYFKVGSILYLLTNLKKRKKDKKMERRGEKDGRERGRDEKGRRNECRKENCILRGKNYFFNM